MKPKLKIEWLAYFCVLVESDSFSAAADQLYISQQALSNYLMRLEKRLNTSLLKRTSQGKQGLTSAGKAFYLYAQQLRQEHLNLEQYFTEMEKQEEVLPISIGIEQLWLNQSLIKFLRAYQIQNANVHINIQGIQKEHQMQTALHEGELDFALLSPTERNLNLSYFTIFESDCVIVTSENTSAPWSELPFIRYFKESENNVDIKHHESVYWLENKYPRRCILETNNLLQAIDWCQEGLGAVYLPQSFVQSWLDIELLYATVEPPETKKTSAALVWNPRLAYNAEYAKLICAIGEWSVKTHPAQISS